MPDDAGCPRARRTESSTRCTQPTGRLRSRSTSQPSADLHADLLVIPVFADDDFSDEASSMLRRAGKFARSRAGRAHRQAVRRVRHGDRVCQLEDASRLCSSVREAARTSRPTHLRRMAIVGGLRCTPAPPDAHCRSSIARVPRSRPNRRRRRSPRELCLANFDGGSYRTGRAPPWIDAARPASPSDGAGVREALERGHMLGDASNQARTLRQRCPATS